MRDAPPTSPAQQRALLRSLLGELPDAGQPVAARRRGEEARDGYVLESWELELNGLEPVPALLARPRELRGRAPAVLFNHSHGGGYDVGKRELVEGRAYLQPVPYARDLTARGWIALAVDHWCFGERARAERGELDTFKAMLWQGQVLWGMMVHDSLRALDWLAARGDVDPARLGTLGMSMGSTMAQWLAALDERVRVTVDLCCLGDWHALLDGNGLAGHGVYYFVPGLLRHFSTAGLNALIVPRAHLAEAGLRDPLTPVPGLDRIDRALQAAYAAAGHPERWRLLRYDVAHQETAEGRAEALAFLERHL
jgi:dienelactone hydrolase